MVGCALGLLLVGTLRAHATEIHRDITLADGGLTLGATELFQFGPFGASGSWGFTNLTVNGNQMGRLVAEGGTGNGGHGASIHLAYPDAFSAHGPLAPGNVLRLSCWLAIDATHPVNRQDWQFALLKFEFFSAALADPNEHPESKLFDSDQDTDGELITSYVDGLSPSEWRQFILEYTVDTNQVDLSQLAEVRPAVVQGDFAGNTFTGCTVIDNLRVEVFKDEADAKAHPVDPTAPGALPSEDNRP
jgi:hypothetical protein